MMKDYNVWRANSSRYLRCIDQRGHSWGCHPMFDCRMLVAFAGFAFLIVSVPSSADEGATQDSGSDSGLAIPTGVEPSNADKVLTLPLADVVSGLRLLGERAGVPDTVTQEKHSSGAHQFLPAKTHTFTVSERRVLDAGLVVPAQESTVKAGNQPTRPSLWATFARHVVHKLEPATTPDINAESGYLQGRRLRVHWHSGRRFVTTTDNAEQE